MTAGIHEVKTDDANSAMPAVRFSADEKTITAAEALEQVVSIIRRRAAAIASAAAEAAVNGQFSHVKYMFELAGICRADGETKIPVEQEEPLTARLLRELGMPTELEDRDVRKQEAARIDDSISEK